MGQPSHRIGEGTIELHLGLWRHQQMQSRCTDDHSGQQLSEDRRQLETNQYFRKRSGCHKNQHETEHTDQRFGDFEVMAADFAQQGRKQHGAAQHTRQTLVVDSDRDSS